MNVDHHPASQRSQPFSPQALAAVGLGEASGGAPTRRLGMRSSRRLGVQVLMPWVLAMTVWLGQARTWTDTTGKKIEADFLRVVGDKVILKFKGKEVPVEMVKLSEEDRQFISEAQQAPPPSPSAKAELKLGDTVLMFGGKINTVEVPLSATALKAYAKADPQPARLKLGIALPADFDPEKPQRVMWASSAINEPKAEQIKNGNFGSLKRYAESAVPAGWVVITADSDLGNPRLEDNLPGDERDLCVHRDAVDLLVKAWPGVKEWPHFCCGFSGGSKASYYRAGQLLESKLRVVGIYLGGTNEDDTDGVLKEVRGVKGSLRRVNIWLSVGKADNLCKPENTEKIFQSLKANYAKVRYEPYEGGHNFAPEEFKKALGWFAELAEK